jgi:hypothetical protein
MGVIFCQYSGVRIMVFVAVIVRVRVRMFVIVLMIVLRLIRELSIHQHIDFRGSNSTAINTAHPKFGAYIQRSDRPLQKFLADAGMKQGAEHHVSADS